MKHVLVLRAKNHHGVLGKITNLLRRRNFNIEGLTAGHTEQNGISHVTVAFSSKDDFNAEQAKKQLSKIIEVLSVKDVESSSVAVREIGLFCVHCNEKLKPALIDAIKLFEGKIIAVGKKSISCEITGTPKRIDDFFALVKNFGIREFQRSSVVAIKSGD